MNAAFISNAREQHASDALVATERLSSFAARFGYRPTKLMLLSVLEEAALLASRIHSSLMTGDINTAAKYACRIKSFAAKWGMSRIADAASAFEINSKFPARMNAAADQIVIAIACVRTAVYGAAPGLEGVIRSRFTLPAS